MTATHGRQERAALGDGKEGDGGWDGTVSCGTRVAADYGRRTAGVKAWVLELWGKLSG